MILYIVACFALVATGLTAIAFWLAPNERTEVRAMIAVRRARKKGTK
jgi:hypothetical protein